MTDHEAVTKTAGIQQRYGVLKGSVRKLLTDSCRPASPVAEPGSRAPNGDHRDSEAQREQVPGV